MTVTRAFLLGALLAIGAAGFARADPRPADWAVPVEKPGLPNLHRVTDWLYRGAQPTTEGMRQLQAMGIHTVVDLRAYHDDSKLWKGTGLTLVRIPVHTADPRIEQVAEFFNVLGDPAQRPIFVHCQHGADRTGLMIALYRIAGQGWTKERAIAEMRDGGFGYHSIWRNLIRFIVRIDIALIKGNRKL
jgi:protein tyrosine phosphatase (PTP) superfamily phosphohydrolase (DUF442 family)